MGVGKSTVGRLLAKELGYGFVDVDELIEKRENKTVAEIFSQQGELSFRKMEKDVTKEVSNLDSYVISCGGGCLLDPDNVQNLRRNALLFLLTAEPHEILKRLEDGKNSRPLLGPSHTLEKLNQLLVEREKKYSQAADLVIDTSRLTADQVAKQISREFRSRLSP